MALDIVTGESGKSYGVVPSSMLTVGVSAGSIRLCAVSPARCGTGWAADIPLFRVLGDLGTPTQSCAGESSFALREIRTD